jgi:hypothetical protein
MPLSDYYPDLICNLPKFSGRFDARKLSAENYDVLFATYPAGTLIEPHRHDTTQTTISTGQWYHVPANKEHSAEFREDTCEIEFWFTE